jgi:hypothetical protein
MSKCTPKSEKFMYEIKRAIENARLYGLHDIKIKYDADPLYSKRDYVVDITIYSSHKWTSDDTNYLKYIMRKAGATSIIGGIKHAIARDYFDLAFDIKKSKMKELGIDISK